MAMFAFIDERKVHGVVVLAPLVPAYPGSIRVYDFPATAVGTPDARHLAV